MEWRRKAVWEALEATGFAEVSSVYSLDEAQELTSGLGSLRSLNGESIQMLSPRAPELARSNSFSRAFGYGQFPLHTDTAFWRSPARYVVCYMPEASSVETVVLPAKETAEMISRHKASNPIFVRTTVSGTFYSAPWFGEGGVVFDPCYMKPVNRAAQILIEEIDRRFSESRPVSWSASKMVVLDNWRVLHGRQAAVNQCRSLYRFYRG